VVVVPPPRPKKQPTEKIKYHAAAGFACPYRKKYYTAKQKPPYQGFGKAACQPRRVETSKAQPDPWPGGWCCSNCSMRMRIAGSLIVPIGAEYSSPERESQDLTCHTRQLVLHYNGTDIV